jgi:hypothetical protein
MITEHDDDCGSWVSDEDGSNPRPCTCGLAALVEKAAKWDALVANGKTTLTIASGARWLYCLESHYEELQADAAKWRAQQMILYGPDNATLVSDAAVGRALREAAITYREQINDDLLDFTNSAYAERFKAHVDSLAAVVEAAKAQEET